MGSLNMKIISTETGGDLRRNKNLLKNLPDDSFTNEIIDHALEGTPMLTFGKGSPKIMLNSGIHGNELSPQLASLNVAQEMADKKLKGTVFMIPFAIPFATMENTRRFKGFDMNRSAYKDGNISNEIIKVVKSLKLDSIADFHATKPYSNPGVESVFCSKNPSPASLEIAEHIKKATRSKIICHKNAGTLYHGALEDECNLVNIPAVTCEVVSYNGRVDPGSQERSYLQMIAYLDYFEISL